MDHLCVMPQYLQMLGAIGYLISWIHWGLILWVFIYSDQIVFIFFDQINTSWMLATIFSYVIFKIISWFIVSYSMIISANKLPVGHWKHRHLKIICYFYLGKGICVIKYHFTFKMDPWQSNNQLTAYKLANTFHYLNIPDGLIYASWFSWSHALVLWLYDPEAYTITHLCNRKVNVTLSFSHYSNDTWVMVFQIADTSTVWLTAGSGFQLMKYQNSAWLSLCGGNPPMVSTHKEPVIQKAFSCHNTIIGVLFASYILIMKDWYTTYNVVLNNKHVHSVTYKEETIPYGQHNWNRSICGIHKHGTISHLIRVRLFILRFAKTKIRIIQYTYLNKMSIIAPCFLFYKIEIWRTFTYSLPAQRVSYAENVWWRQHVKRYVCCMHIFTLPSTCRWCGALTAKFSYILWRALHSWWINWSNPILLLMTVHHFIF